MKYVAVAILSGAMLAAFQVNASACDQKEVMNPYFLNIPITSANYGKIAESALAQADALRSCIAQSSGHQKTQYLLMRAVALSTAAQSMDNMAVADRTKEALYSKEAVAIATPIANDPSALEREKKGARGILTVSAWLKKIE